MINFSELLWKPAGSNGSSLPAPLCSDSENLAEVGEFSKIPIEEVHLQPEMRIALFNNPRSPGADRYRFLRMRLQEVKDATKLQKLLITSPLPQDGKSTVALNLATALAEHGKRNVLLIEADLYHPTIVQRLGLQIRPGLGACLEGGMDALSALRQIQPLGWYLLPAGELRENPTELLHSESISGVLQRLSAYFDWILIDTPPVVPLTDAVSLSRHVDATLLVVRAGCTPQGTVKEALSLLGPKRVLGIVFNAAEGLNRLYSEYYGYYSKK